MGCETTGEAMWLINQYLQCTCSWLIEPEKICERRNSGECAAVAFGRYLMGVVLKGMCSLPMSCCGRKAHGGVVPRLFKRRLLAGTINNHERYAYDIKFCLGVKDS